MTSVLDDANSRGSAGAVPRTAGALLREARQSQGLSVAALAATLKVPVAKIEALEADRLDALPDATFVRALAKAMCAALRIDVAPVLDLLPKGGMPELDRVSRGLNQPFRERQAGGDLLSAQWLRNPVAWGVAVLLAAAAGLYLLPQEGWQWPWQSGGESAGTAGATVDTPAAVPLAQPSASMSPPEVVSGAGLTAPATGPAAASALPGSIPTTAPSPAAVPGALVADKLANVPAAAQQQPSSQGPAATTVQDSRMAPLKIRVSDASWVEVLDARGQVLHSRLMRAGEVAEVSGLPPLKLRVGNVAGTEVSFRGALIDLAAQARDNVARLELP